MAKHDPDFWNVISIRSPAHPRIEPRGFLKIHTILCDDVPVGVQSGSPENIYLPRREHLQGAFHFVDSLGAAPLLVHCMAGISRSTGVALSIIVRAMHLDGFSREEILRDAPEYLLAMRPQAAPNPLILKLGLEEFLPPADAQELASAILAHPVLVQNRDNVESPAEL